MDLCGKTGQNESQPEPSADKPLSFDVQAMYGE
jgi:hypothetical protein